MLSCNCPFVVHDILLISLLSASTGCNVPITVAQEMQTLSYAVLGMGIFSDFGYLWSIL